MFVARPDANLQASLFANLADVNLPAPRIGVHQPGSASTATAPLMFRGVGDEAPGLEFLAGLAGRAGPRGDLQDDRHDETDDHQERSGHWTTHGKHLAWLLG